MPEKGEELRICPDKEAAETSRYLAAVGVPGGVDPSLSSSDLAYMQRAVRFKPKPREELACPTECPGKITVPRKWGRIVLPSFFDKEECPLNP